MGAEDYIDFEDLAENLIGEDEDRARDRVRPRRDPPKRAAARASVLFNGIYTIESPKGGHRTFRVRTERKGKLGGKRVLSLLIGPDNTGSYRGFAFVTDDGVAIWKRFCSQPDHPAFVTGVPDRATWLTGSKHEQYATMLWSLAVERESSQFHEMGYALHMEGRCLVCNRRLTTPESIRSGIGPICAGRTN